eukprot:360184-Chlamydomonas_euryale.AAC.2
MPSAERCPHGGSGGDAGPARASRSWSLYVMYRGSSSSGTSSTAGRIAGGGRATLAPQAAVRLYIGGVLGGTYKLPGAGLEG